MTKYILVLVDVGRKLAARPGRKLAAPKVDPGLGKPH